MIEPNKLFGRLGNRMFQMAFIYAQMKDGITSDIYVQDYTLFDKYSEDIKKWFGDGIGFLPYVAIHVRRGDYINNSHYVDLCQTDYFEKAVKLFPNKKFLVFCKDRQSPEKDEADKKWCIEYFDTLLGKNYQFMENDNEIEDLNMMASCESVIMANSSFSFWAAYLCPNFGKTIICPKQWFSGKINRVNLPPEWIQL